MTEIPWGSPFEQSTYSLKNEEQEGKTGPVWRWRYQWEEEG
jgi:hypothetical protein